MCICYLMSKNFQLKTNKLKLYKDVVYNAAKTIFFYILGEVNDKR